MIIGISNVHTGDLVLPGLLAIGLVWLGYLAIQLTDLCINTMRRQSTMDQHADVALRLASKDRQPPYVGFDDPPEIAPEDEPSWPGKVSPPERHLFALHEQAIVAGGNPARFDLTGLTPAGGVLIAETLEETSGRHARIDGDNTATGLMPAVADDEPALAEEVGVS